MNNLKEKLIKEESKELDKNIDIITSKVLENDEKIKSYELDDINTYKTIDESQYTKIVNENKKYSEILNKPYYGKMDIDFNDGDDVKPIYVGYKNIEDENGEIIIASWASPIANIFNMNTIGEYNYKHIDRTSGRDNTYAGSVMERRRIDINNKKVIDVSSTKVVGYEKEEEEFINQKVEQSNTNKLGSIVETVSKIQNEIIRLPIEKNVLVQGCAGSGKSSVAFSRIAFLNYNYDIKEDEILVISPNKLFSDYTNEVAIELGMDINPQQFTFEDYAKHILKDDIKNANIRNIDKDDEVTKLKTSKLVMKLIDDFLEEKLDNALPNESVLVGSNVFIDNKQMKSIWKNELSTYSLNRRVDRFKTYIDRIISKSAEDIIEYEKNTYKSEIADIEKYSINRKNKVEVLELYKKEYNLKLERLKKHLNLIKDGYINSIRMFSPLELYREFLSKITKYIEKYANELSLEELNGLSELNSLIMTNVDLIPILYIYFNTNEYNKKIRHTVIDECQDLSYMEVSILEKITRTFTLVGDFNQRLSINKSNIVVEDIQEIFSKATYLETYYLNKSFRNSKEITNYTNKILKPYFINEKFIPESINRETENPRVIMSSNSKSLESCIIESIKEKREMKNTAVILKNREDVINFATKLNIANIKDYNTILSTEDKYKCGINILDVKLCKGLEFDNVVIPDADNYLDNEVDRRLLYIATSRALNKLELYVQNSNSFIAKLDETLCEKKDKINDDKATRDLKDMIIKTLKDGFGELREEYIDYIDNLSSLGDVLKFFGELPSITNLDQFFQQEKGVNVIENQELKKIIERITNNKTIFTGKQIDVYNFLLNNLEEITQFKSANEFSASLSVSPTTVNVVLMKLNLGTYPSLYNKIKRIIED